MAWSSEEEKPAPGPWDDNRKRADLGIIHECAMLCLDCDERTAQSRIMDFIIARCDKVPLFMLNSVPMYVEGWKAAKRTSDYEP